MKYSPVPRDNIARLAPYPLDSAASGDTPGTVNLQYNEHWAPLSDRVRAACHDALGNSHLYPETSAAPLRSVLARHHDIDRDRIVCANGSSELISLLCQIYCRNSDEIVIGPFSYMYFRTAAKIAGATPIMASCKGMQLAVDDLLNSVTERTRILFVDNPQNPLGDYFNATDIRLLRQQLPDHILLVIDAAYAEYADAADYQDALQLVEEQPNTVVLRTFSKIYGLAGLRIGWAYAPEKIASYLNRVRQPNNLSGVSVAAALASMGEQDLVAERARQNSDWRSMLSATLSSRFGFGVRPSQANFILAGLPDSYPGDASRLAGEVEQHGVLIRPMASYGLPQHVRITIAPEHALERLVGALEKVPGLDPAKSD